MGKVWDVLAPRNLELGPLAGSARGQGNTVYTATGMGTEMGHIADLLNKSRGDIAYTLLDTDAPIGPEVVGKLRAIPGVLSARLI